jgi:hypothetical protein
MKTIDKYRKDFADLRDSILVEIGSIIRTRPNWYMKIQDVQGKLIFRELDMQSNLMMMSVTVKDFGDQGEKEVVWLGVNEEEFFVEIEKALTIEQMINVLEAMYYELDHWDE